MATRTKVEEMLSGGDRRMIGRSEEAARLARNDATLLSELVHALASTDVLVRMRAADALEKITRAKPEIVAPFKADLLQLAKAEGQQQVRWHLAQMLPRLRLNGDERMAAVEALQAFLLDKSAIVRAWSLNAIAEIADQDSRFAAMADRLLGEASKSPSAAVRTRAKLILAQRQARAEASRA